MAGRAAVRRAEREAVEAREREAAIVKARAAIDEIAGRDGWDWLNGWPRMGEDGSGVLMGTSVRCVGCGRNFGTTCVVFPDGWEPPGPEPRWPLPADGCPVCAIP